MSLNVPENETPEADDSALRNRALRFAGVHLPPSVDVAKPRPELVAFETQDDRLEMRVDRFVRRTTQRQ